MKSTIARISDAVVCLHCEKTCARYAKVQRVSRGVKTARGAINPAAPENAEVIDRRVQWIPGNDSAAGEQRAESCLLSPVSRGA